jgi:hypothetical protein
MVNREPLTLLNLNLIEELAQSVTNELLDELLTLNESETVDNKTPASQEVINNLPIKISKTEDKVCPICLDKIKKGDKVSKLSCSHEYHHSCLIKWLSRDNSCPVCRCKIKNNISNKLIFITVFYPDQSILYKSFDKNIKIHNFFDIILNYIDKKGNIKIDQVKSDNTKLSLKKINNKTLNQLGFKNGSKIKIYD